MPVYKIDDVIVDSRRHTVKFPSSTVSVRPKTFQLLVMFLEAPGQTLEKAYLLESIWDDVHVDEQVLFQSVREIRKLFGQLEVIKTYPRKGYCWVADVERVNDSALVKSASNRFFVNFFKKEVGRYQRSLGCALTVFAVLLGYVHWADSDEGGSVINHTHSINGSVMVLPINNLVAGRDHQWVNLGGMDQLIVRLARDAKITVMNTEYALQALERVGLTRHYENKEVAHLFKSSGVALAVASRLSGNVGEYQLIFWLHSRDFVRRGVIFADTIDKALFQLAERITQEVGQDTLNRVHDNSGALAEYRSDFNNELLARALDYLGEGKKNAARDLLASVVHIEPENLVARRLLANILFEEGDYSEAAKHIEQGLAYMSSAESARLLMLRAEIEGMQGDLNAAMLTLGSAYELAEHFNDRLYQAFALHGQGKIAALQGQFEKAQSFYQGALTLHEAMNCVMGRALLNISMGDLALQYGASVDGQKYHSQASTLIENYRLDDLLVLLPNQKNNS